MYKLFNKLFGWRYCIFCYAYDYELCSIKTFPNGVEYVQCSGKTFLISELKSEVARNFMIITK
jgi:hypothetical protein